MDLIGFFGALLRDFSIDGPYRRLLRGLIEGLIVAPCCNKSRNPESSTDNVLNLPRPFGLIECCDSTSTIHYPQNHTSTKVPRWTIGHGGVSVVTNHMLESLILNTIHIAAVADRLTRDLSRYKFKIDSIKDNF